MKILWTYALILRFREIQRNLCHCDYLVSLMPRTFRWSQSNQEVRQKIFERRLRRHFHNNAPWYSFFLFSFIVDKKENRSTDIRTNAKAFHTQTPRNIYIYIYRAQGVYKINSQYTVRLSTHNSVARRAHTSYNTGCLLTHD